VFGFSGLGGDGECFVYGSAVIISPHLFVFLDVRHNPFPSFLDRGMHCHHGAANRMVDKIMFIDVTAARHVDSSTSSGMRKRIDYVLVSRFITACRIPNCMMGEMLIVRMQMFRQRQIHSLLTSSKAINSFNSTRPALLSKIRRRFFCRASSIQDNLTSI